MSSKYGIDIWYDGEDAEVDIVFLHGLRGHREKTWTRESDLDSSQRILWPKELLAEDVKKSRILSFGYDSGVVHSDTAKVTQNDLAKVAREFCTKLHAKRSESKTTDRPIITIAHSLGGLVAAQAIVLGSESAEGDSTNSVSSNIRGMIFLGTPFRGSKLAKWADMIRKLFSVVRDTDKGTLKVLDIDSKECEFLRRSFPDNVRRRRDSKAPNPIRVIFCYETLTTMGTMIVNMDSASFEGVGELVPMTSDHLQICKFFSRDDEGYTVVKERVLAIIEEIVAKKKESEETGLKGNQFYNYGNLANQGENIKFENQTNHFGPLPEAKRGNPGN